MSEPREQRTGPSRPRSALVMLSELIGYGYQRVSTAWMAVRAVPNKNLAVIELGDNPAQLRVYLHALDLDRLHALMHDAFTQLHQEHSFAAEEAPEAFAAGWDAALSWVHTATGDGVPANLPGGES